MATQPPYSVANFTNSLEYTNVANNTSLTDYNTGGNFGNVLNSNKESDPGLCD